MNPRFRKNNHDYTLSYKSDSQITLILDLNIGEGDPCIGMKFTDISHIKDKKDNQIPIDICAILTFCENSATAFVTKKG